MTINLNFLELLIIVFGIAFFVAFLILLLLVCRKRPDHTGQNIMSYRDLLQVFICDQKCLPPCHILKGDYEVVVLHLKNIVDYMTDHTDSGKIPRVIEKKILPQYFSDVYKGNKRFEIRRDEDNIEVGDILLLRELCGNDHSGCTGNYVVRKVKYVLRDCKKFGLRRGYCIISF